MIERDVPGHIYNGDFADLPRRNLHDKGLRPGVTLFCQSFRSVATNLRGGVLITAHAAEMGSGRAAWGAKVGPKPTKDSAFRGSRDGGFHLAPFIQVRTTILPR